MDRELFQNVVEMMAEGVVVQDAETNIVYANEAVCELSGYSASELIGRSTAEFVSPAFVEHYRQQLRLRLTGSTQAYETHIVSKSGEPIPVLVSPQPIFNGGGELAGSFAVVSDMRVRQRSELEREVISQIVRGVVVTSNLDELLTLIHESLKKVIYAENCFVALLDAEADMIEFPYFVDQHDAEQEPIRRGKSCTDYVLRHGLPLLLTQEKFENLVEEGEVELVGPSSPSWMGVPLMTPTRTIGVLAVQHYQDEGAFSERDLEFFGSVAGHIALAIERKRAEELIHAGEDLLSNVVESMSDGVLVLDRDFRYLHWNRAMEKISNTPRQEVVGKDQNAWELFPHLTDLGIDSMMRAAMLGEPQLAMNLEHQLPDGSFKITNETFRPLRGPEGEIRGVVGVVRDVTERRESEIALAESEEQLRQAQKMEAIGRLASGVAHDFNNLLTAINGYSELVLDNLQEQDPIREHVEKIRMAGENAADVTQQLLAFSRKQVIQPRVVDLNQIIGDLESMLRRLIGEDIELVTDLDSGLHNIKTDPGQIEQVIINLVVNARDAMTRGGSILIRTHNRALEQPEVGSTGLPGPYVGLEVVDDGAGMETEVMSRIFEPFFTTKPKGKGTGMGLSTVYGIVKQNGGHVWVDSTLDQGSSFRLCFPPTEEPVNGRVVRTVFDQDLQGSETVLVVEDEDAVRNLVRMILERHGYRVVEASGADEAIRLARSAAKPIDVLVTDVVMPKKSGPELAAELQERYPDLKVMFMSGHPDDTILEHGVLLPDVELLVKPFSVKDLLGRLQQVLHEWRPDTAAHS